MVGSVPIPVGHRVVVEYFESFRESRGLFGTGEPRVKTRVIDSPRVTDEDTGIVHGHLAHYDGGGSLQGGKINAGTQQLRTDVRVRERIEGVVVACRLAMIGFEGISAPTCEQYETVLEIATAGAEDR